MMSRFVTLCHGLSRFLSRFVTLYKPHLLLSQRFAGIGRRGSFYSRFCTFFPMSVLFLLRGVWGEAVTVCHAVEIQRIEIECSKCGKVVKGHIDPGDIRFCIKCNGPKVSAKEVL